MPEPKMPKGWYCPICGQTTWHQFPDDCRSYKENDDSWPKYKGPPIVLMHAWLYEILERQGVDMGFCQKLEPMPYIEEQNNARTDKR